MHLSSWSSVVLLSGLVGLACSGGDAVQDAGVDQGPARDAAPDRSRDRSLDRGAADLAPDGPGAAGILSIDPSTDGHVWALATSPTTDRAALVFQKKVNGKIRLHVALFDGTTFASPITVDSEPQGGWDYERVWATFLPKSDKLAVVAERLENDKIRVYGHFHDGTTFAPPTLVDPGPTPLANPMRFYAMTQHTSSVEDSGFVVISAKPEGFTTSGIWVAPLSSAGYGAAVRVDVDLPAGDARTPAPATSSTSRGLLCFWQVNASPAERHFYCATLDGSSVGKPKLVDHGAMPVEDADSYPEVVFSKSASRAVIIYSYDDGTGLLHTKAYGVIYDGQSFSAATPLMATDEYGLSAWVRFSSTTEDALVTYLKNTASADTSIMTWIPVGAAFGKASTLDPKVDLSLSFLTWPRLQFAPQSEEGLLLYAARPSGSTQPQLVAYTFDGSKMTSLSPQVAGYMAFQARFLTQSDRAVCVVEQVPSGGSSLGIYGLTLEKGVFSAQQRLDPGRPNTSVNATTILPHPKSDAALIVMRIDDMMTTHETHVALFDGKSFQPATPLPSCKTEVVSATLGSSPRFLLVCKGTKGIYGKIVP